MNAELLKMLLSWAKEQLAEKLAHKKKEKSVEQLALAKISTVLASYAPRYGEKVDVQEIYDKISAVIAETEGLSNGPLAERQPFAPNPITATYASKFLGVKWGWPGIVGPSDLWYTELPPILVLGTGFRRVNAFVKGQKGDIVVLDNRIGNGYGATGILVEDCGDTIKVYVDDMTSLQYRILGKAAVLGYFRPITTENA